MPDYTVSTNKIHFRQSHLPVMFFVTLGMLGVYVELTGSKRYPYAVIMSESEFLSTIELSEGA